LFGKSASGKTGVAKQCRFEVEAPSGVSARYPVQVHQPKRGVSQTVGHHVSLIGKFAASKGVAFRNLHHKTVPFFTINRCKTSVFRHMLTPPNRLTRLGLSAIISIKKSVAPHAACVWGTVQS